MSAKQPWHDPEWQVAHRVRLDTSRAMADRVGPEHGIAPKDLADLAARAEAVHEDLTRRRRKGELAFFDLPSQDTAPVLEAASWVRDRFDTFILVGIGGSSLGPKATQQALNSPYYNLLPAQARGGPRFFLLENIDPHSLAALLEVADPARTCVNVVTKSGGTAETAANYMAVREWLNKRVAEPTTHLIATTDPKDGDLRKLAKAEGWHTLAVPPAVGGRFSQLTAVGLLPAAVCGVDIRELLAGAADMEVRTRSADLETNPAYLFGALHYLADTRKAKPICVMMPYADGLTGLADWFVQLWAESLGKAVDVDGRPAHTGQTPLAAVGAIDQHSQLQLFVEGPNNKLFTFLQVEHFRTPGAIPPLHADVSAMGYLGGATFERLLHVEQAATEMVLTDHGRPNLRIDVPELSAFALGQLYYLFEVATAFAGGLYRVDPFDQPGVEHGKKLAYGAMGRKGFKDLMGK